MKLRECFFNLLGVNKPASHHPELGTSRIRNDETVAISVTSALREWDADPWTYLNLLFALTSRRLATSEVTKSLNSVHSDENEVVDNFFVRLTQGNKSVYATISKRKTLNFATLAVTNKPNRAKVKW